ncbi:uncharacterized protein C7orf61 homolog isoform X1 [Myotis lucifugus]|uniref:uncharacterized protein C7orf61 homolog isoform X1 n=1 Tax=Myotis lucifugus TaxID=59463 RepID=UPI000CCC6555|nr:uncharacterized protein C7orf61 homolog isoform X1 [Myotis lucifugus]
MAIRRLFQWVWRKITSLVFFWKHRAKSTIVEHPDSKKSALKMEKASSVVETCMLVEPLKEAKVCRMGVFSKVADPCTLAKTTDGAKVELDRGSRSLLQLPRTAAKSVSTLMVSAFQSGWQMCSWKSSERIQNSYISFTQFSPMVPSFKTIVQHHHQEIEIDAIYRHYADFTCFTFTYCVCACVCI